jgi:hypothetical protein
METELVSIEIITRVRTVRAKYYYDLDRKVNEVIKAEEAKGGYMSGFIPLVTQIFVGATLIFTYERDPDE